MAAGRRHLRYGPVPQPTPTSPPRRSSPATFFAYMRVDLPRPAAADDPTPTWIEQDFEAPARRLPPQQLRRRRAANACSPASTAPRSASSSLKPYSPGVCELKPRCYVGPAPAAAADIGRGALRRPDSTRRPGCSATGEIAASHALNVSRVEAGAALPRSFGFGPDPDPPHLRRARGHLDARCALPMPALARRPAAAAASAGRRSPPRDRPASSAPASRRASAAASADPSGRTPSVIIAAISASL